MVCEEDIIELYSHIPLIPKDVVELNYIEYYKDLIEFNLNSKKYQQAYISCHLIFMYVLYCYILRIRNFNPKTFLYSLFWIKDDDKKDWDTSDSPFIFSTMREREILKFLKLIKIDDSKIGNYKKIVDFRNDLLHANGLLMYSDEQTFKSELNKILNCLNEINIRLIDNTTDIYLKFMKNSFNHLQREYEDVESQVEQVLIKINSLNLIDMKELASMSDKAFGELKRNKDFNEILNYIKNKYSD